ncbi:hypothetical protein PFISCL1PPCAC_9345 [Pristionchus fissidentatus]|uniref:Uncharacterized protein n=1 Tax=Pristionchus fissidentatus TaxID=1538716 RepID=A0AAV5VFI3_9BILA|nr:hypothetical protein PFISCL1PPCAC_9345 [Pristionchus fissidentatus]
MSNDNHLYNAVKAKSIQAISAIERGRKVKKFNQGSARCQEGASDSAMIEGATSDPIDSSHIISRSFANRGLVRMRKENCQPKEKAAFQNEIQPLLRGEALSTAEDAKAVFKEEIWWTRGTSTVSP